MNSINAKQFISAVNQWAQWRQDWFKYTWCVKGGWEGWIQVDLTAYILSKTKFGDILREQSIYKDSRMRVDLLLNPQSTQNNNGAIPVEIKAESFGNHTAFIKGVKEDLKKITDARNDTYGNSTCIMLAMLFSPEAYKNIKLIKSQNQPIFQVKTIGNGEVAVAYAVWTNGGWLSSKS